MAKVLIVLGIGLLIASGIMYGAIRFFVDNEASEAPDQSIGREYPPKPSDIKTFEQDNFGISLPGDWQLKERKTTPVTSYTWQATKKHADNRWLEVYIGDMPPGKAFNRLLPVLVKNNKITLSGSVSDNCTELSPKQNPGQAIWRGVTFACDTANPSRNVVGVGSPTSGHKFVLSGAKSGSRSFIFVYTDHNANPNYQILEYALTSFTVK